MIDIKCDRCGKVIPKRSAVMQAKPRKAIIYLSTVLNLEKVDLCDDCEKDFFKWLEKENNDGEIKPCPFCGCEADTAYNTQFNYQVFCTNDECFMNTITMYGKATEKEAIEAWNRRARNDD